MNNELLLRRRKKSNNLRKREVKDDFIPLIAPLDFNSPYQYRDFGLDVDIYTKTKQYERSDLDIIWSGVFEPGYPAQVHLSDYTGDWLGVAWGDSETSYNYSTNCRDNYIFTERSTNRWCIIYGAKNSDFCGPIRKESISYANGLVCFPKILYLGKGILDLYEVLINYDFDNYANVIGVFTGTPIVQITYSFQACDFNNAQVQLPTSNNVNMLGVVNSFNIIGGVDPTIKLPKILQRCSDSFQNSNGFKNIICEWDDYDNILEYRRSAGNIGLGQYNSSTNPIYLTVPDGMYSSDIAGPYTQKGWTKGVDNYQFFNINSGKVNSFYRFIAPTNYDSPYLYNNFGIDSNIKSFYDSITDPNKLYGACFSPGQSSVIIGAPRGSTIYWMDSTTTTTQTAVVDFTPPAIFATNSKNRVMVVSTPNTTSVDIRPIAASSSYLNSITMVYLGSKITKIGSSYIQGNKPQPISLKYIFTETENQIKTIGDYGLCDCLLTGELNLSGVESIGVESFARQSSIIGHLQLPDSVGNNIGMKAFSTTGIETIGFSNTMTTIIDGLFEYCTNLRGNINGGFKIPDNITYLANSVFYGCVSLITPTFNDNITYIGSHCFYGCLNIRNWLTLPNNEFYTTIQSHCFYNTNAIVLRTFDNIKTISDNAFNHSPNLIWLLQPSSYTYIGDYAFANCPKLGLRTDNSYSFSTPSTLTHVGEGAFQNSKLGQLTLNSNLSYIGASAFRNCQATGPLILPTSLLLLSKYVFANNSFDNLVTIPASVLHIYEGCFYEATNASYYALYGSWFRQLTGIIQINFALDRTQPLTLNSRAFYGLNIQLSAIDGSYRWYLPNIKTIGSEALSQVIYCKAPSQASGNDILVTANIDLTRGCETLDWQALRINDSITSLINMNGFGASKGYILSLDLPSNITTINNAALYGAIRYISFGGTSATHIPTIPVAGYYSANDWYLGVYSFEVSDSWVWRPNNNIPRVTIYSHLPTSVFVAKNYRVKGNLSGSQTAFVESINSF